uniref:Putative ovule protein n=1 Tax=Solanum chacoense TaxID=4108 RepID=A0A0V0GR21_SOLCH
MLKECKLLNKWEDMCQYLVNMGLGPDLGNPQRIFSNKGWYTTNQFSLEVLFHNRMKQYDCLTNDSSEASAVFVPYYSGFDVARYFMG